MKHEGALFPGKTQSTPVAHSDVSTAHQLLPIFSYPYRSYSYQVKYLKQHRFSALQMIGLDLSL